MRHDGFAAQGDAMAVPLESLLFKPQSGNATAKGSRSAYHQAQFLFDPPLDYIKKNTLDILQ